MERNKNDARLLNFVKCDLCTYLSAMRVDVEIYKGIEFVRLSNLPAEQKENIKSWLPKDRLIKILKDEMVLSDCIQYSDYLRWYEEYNRTQQAASLPDLTHLTSEFKLSLK